MPASYHQRLLDRLRMINELGDSATQNALGQAQGMNAASVIAGMPQVNLPGGSTPGGSFGKFVSAIVGQESGGNYGAVNRDSGALGKYQIMPGNIRGAKTGWDYEALGRDVSTNQFLGSAQIQDAIAQYKLKSYYDKWGPAGAAVAWYAGPGTVSGYLKNPGAYTNPQGAYPSIANYVNSVLGRMR